MITIGITGPESSGKTTISEYIAKEFNAYLVEEYARKYLSNKPKYDLIDLIKIAKEQFKKIKNAQKKQHLIICDTELTVIKVWVEDKFKEYPKEIKKLYLEQKIDLYILCKPDIPWTHDKLREDKYRREELFNKYKEELDLSKKKYYILSGNKEDRKLIVKDLIQTFLNKNKDITKIK